MMWFTRPRGHAVPVYRVRRPIAAISNLRSAITCAPPGTEPAVSQGLYLFWLDGLFIALSFSFYSTFMGLWLLGFGATNSHVGLMTSLSSFCGVGAYLLATRATRAFGGRQRTVVLGRAASRVVLVLIALVPFLTSGLRAVYLTIALVCLQVICENLANPAWTGLVADIVPLPIRARYIASRNLAKSVARTFGVALAGQLIRGVGFPAGYQTAFLIAAVVGLGAAWAYARIPLAPDEAPSASPQAQATTGPEGRTLTRYMLARGVWTLGYYLATPFYPLFAVAQLGATEATVGLLASTGSLAAVVGMLSFSRAVERQGLRRMWLAASVLEATLPLLWAVAPRLWFAFLPAALDGLLLAGLELINLATILGLTAPENRTRFIAANSAVLGVATMVGPLVGGLLSDAAGFMPTFVVASALSAVGCGLYYRYVPEPYPHPGPTPPRLEAATEGSRL